MNASSQFLFVRTREVHNHKQTFGRGGLKRQGRNCLPTIAPTLYKEYRLYKQKLWIGTQRLERKAEGL